MTYDSGCGSADCPWLIEGGRGTENILLFPDSTIEFLPEFPFKAF